MIVSASIESPIIPLWAGPKRNGGKWATAARPLSGSASSFENVAIWQRAPLSDEPTWRGSAAVRNDWNGDGGYVEAPSAGLKGWIGSAAPQDASVPGYMLPGQGEQIWLPSNVAKPGAPIATPWNGAGSK